MTERELRERLNRMAGDVPEETHLAFTAAAVSGKERIIVKKKISAGLVFAIVLALIAAAAVAAGIIYNQEWWWNNRNVFEKEDKPEVYEAIMANLTENPEQVQCEDDQVQVIIQDVSWAPEADIMTISFKAAPKNPEKDELHSMWALDTDGSYIGEGGSTAVTDDSEDRAMHWLWRTDIGLADGPGGYGHIPGYGPVPGMMDDNRKRLLLIDYAETSILIDSPEIENVADMFSMGSSMDMFRTAEGDVYFVGQFDLSWLKDEYDRKMREYANESPDMKDYYEQKIAAAQAARERLNREGITCYLTYRVVEYTEGMDDLELYTGGGGRSVQFIIRPGQ